MPLVSVRISDCFVARVKLLLCRLVVMLHPGVSKVYLSLLFFFWGVIGFFWGCLSFVWPFVPCASVGNITSNGL